jgi:hypothetical protein
LTRIRNRFAILAAICALPVALAACGDGGGSEDPQQVLDQTFDNPTEITSGHLDLSLSGSAEGQQSGNLTATIDGAFQTEQENPATFPQLDLNAKLNASGAGQSFSFQGGVVATKDNAFVEYQGQAYEVGSKLFGRFTQAYERATRQAQAAQGGQGSSFFDQFGIDPRSWLTNLSNEGDEDVEGTDTTHIHGDANVKRIVSDLGKVAKRAPGGAPQISPDQLDQLESAIEEASIDLYSGKDDHVLRKLSLSLTLTPPEGADTQVSSVSIDFSLTLSDVNETQTIEAPSGVKPISDLLKQLGIGGGGGPLGSLGSAGGASAPGAGNGGGGGASQAYLNCIQDAQSADEINKCAQSLQ